MVVALLSIALHIPEARSLKDKRMEHRSVKDRLKKFNVAAAEVEHQDLWQRTELGVVTVATTTEQVDRTFASVVDEIERAAPGMLTETHVEYLT